MEVMQPRSRLDLCAVPGFKLTLGVLAVGAPDLPTPSSAGATTGRKPPHRGAPDGDDELWLQRRRRAHPGGRDRLYLRSERKRALRGLENLRLRPREPPQDDDAGEHDDDLHLRRGRQAPAGLDLSAPGSGFDRAVRQLREIGIIARIRACSTPTHNSRLPASEAVTTLARSADSLSRALLSEHSPQSSTLSEFA